MPGWSLHTGGSEEEKVINQFSFLCERPLQLAASVIENLVPERHAFRIVFLEPGFRGVHHD